MTYNEKLLLLKEEINSYFNLMGSKWGNTEAEIIAIQTICACGLNLEQHGDAFSWQGTGTTVTSGGRLFDNPKGVNSLLADTSLILEEYENPQNLEVPKGTVYSNNDKPMIFRCTEKLLDYAIKFMKL